MTRSLPDKADVVGASAPDHAVQVEQGRGGGSGNRRPAILLGADGDNGAAAGAVHAGVCPRELALVGADLIGGIERAVDGDAGHGGAGACIELDDLVLKWTAGAARVLGERLQVSAVSVCK